MPLSWCQPNTERQTEGGLCARLRGTKVKWREVARIETSSLPPVVTETRVPSGEWDHWFTVKGHGCGVGATVRAAR